MFRSRILILALAATLAMPPALATWMNSGEVEPNTQRDLLDSFMWTDAPDHIGPQVYLNAFLVSGYTGMNTNVAALNTRFDDTGGRMILATFGVWRDCNGDGYIGHAESAVMEYRAELLPANHNCPIKVPTKDSPQTHNDGKWVTELLYIGNPRASSSGGDDSAPATPTKDARIYRDTNARVWADVGILGEDLGEGPAEATCAISPQPRGTWQSTGGFLNYVNCYIGVGTTYNNVHNFNLPAATPDDVEGPAEEALTPFRDPAGLALEDENDWRGSAVDVATFGPEDSGQSAAYVWDCSSEPATSQTVAGNEITVYNVAPSVGSGTSVAGTVNATVEGAPVSFGGDSMDCDTENDNGGDVYERLGESDNEGTSQQGPKAKSAADYNFRYVDMARGGAPGKALDVQDPKSHVPQDLGIAVVGRNNFGAYWSSNTILVGTTPSIPARVVLGSVTEPNPQVLLGGATTYITTYASVGTDLSPLNFRYNPDSRTGVYGDEWCNGVTSGAVMGFNCDADEWNIGADGQPARDQTLVAVGQVYQIRDVDCYDSSFAGSPWPTTCE